MNFSVNSIESSAQFEDLLVAAGMGAWEIDLLTGVVNFFGLANRLHGYEGLKQTSIEALFKNCNASDREKLKSYITANKADVAILANEVDFRIIMPDSEEEVRWLRCRGQVRVNEKLIPATFVGVVQDITKEIHSRKQQEKLLALVDNSIELMSILENDQRNSYINKAGMAMLGFESMEEVSQTPISDLHTPEDIAFVQANVLPSVLGTGKWSGEMNVRHLKTGEVFPVFNNTVRINDSVTGEPIAIGAVMRDMRPEKAAQHALEESEKAFRTLVMQAPVGICIVTVPDLVIEIANDTFLEVANSERSAVVGKSVIESFPEAMSQGFVEILHKVITTKQPVYGKEVKVIQERASGSRTIYVDFVFEPLFEKDGTVKRIMDVSIDVTEKVNAKVELLRNEAELQKRVAERTAELEKKNKELEEFTYVSSHDLREPIRKIRIFSEMIKDKDYEQLSDYSKIRFEKIIASAQRMSDSLTELLNFAALNKEEVTEDIPLEEIVRSVEIDLELLIEQTTARITKANLPVITGVRQQLHQLFYNLINNSLKFTRKDSKPEIEINYSLISTEDASVRFQRDVKHACHLITIKDNGIGFESEKSEQIFGLFQRLHTSDSFSGSGIGLAVCRKVMDKHNGWISARSTPGQGSEFYVVFPV